MAIVAALMASVMSWQVTPAMAQDGVVPFLEGLAAIDDRMVMVLNLQALNADSDEIPAIAA